ncbi:MAG: hypothetical protein ACE5G1_17115, partial [bacterium]
MTLSAMVAGIVGVFQLLKYIFTRNLPWLARLSRRAVRWVRRRIGRKHAPPGQRYLVVNFSSHPLLPGQQKTIQAKMGWPALEVIDAGLNVPEGDRFVNKAIE